MNVADGGTLNPLREPALLIAALLAPAVQTGLLVWGGLSDGGQAVWNAVAAAVAGVIMAVLAAGDRLAPAITGLAVAVLALAAWYGWHLDARQQTEILSLVSLATGLFLRTQITAPVDADGRPRGTLVVAPVARESDWPYRSYRADDDPDRDDPDRDDPDRVAEPPSFTGAEPPLCDTPAMAIEIPGDITPPPRIAPPPPEPRRTVAPIEGRRMSG